MNYANRGTELEQIIEIANSQYRNKQIACINKVPTPTKILSNGKGFYSQKSTVDFAGTVIGGKFVCFDAKQTNQLNRFPLENIHDHQMEYMQEITWLGGIAFIIIYFKKLDEFYRLDFQYLKDYWNEYQLNKGKKGYGSIPKCDFKTQVIKESGIVLHYLKGVI